jgi:hypothetical protein
MSITYTTGWARKEIKTLEQWNSWVQSLKEGNRVLVQQFIPRGDSCLDSQVECWRFWEGTYQVDLVIYNRDAHPLKDGYCVYWNSNEKWGDVFGARIVPWHNDVAPRIDDLYRDCHAPVFDENWTGDRHLVLVPFGKNFPRGYYLIKNKFPYHRPAYPRQINPKNQ